MLEETTATPGMALPRESRCQDASTQCCQTRALIQAVSPHGWARTCLCPYGTTAHCDGDNSLPLSPPLRLQ